MRQSFRRNDQGNSHDVLDGPVVDHIWLKRTMTASSPDVDGRAPGRFKRVKEFRRFHHAACERGVGGGRPSSGLVYFDQLCRRRRGDRSPNAIDAGAQDHPVNFFKAGNMRLGRLRPLQA